MVQTYAEKLGDSNGFVQVTKDNFLNYFNLEASATYDKSTGIVTLTEAKGNQVGNFTLNGKIDMNQSFTLTGYVNLGSNKYGADGVSFAFHSGNTNDIGVFGGNLGIGGLENAVGFKLDTYKNGYKTPSSSGDATNQYGWEADPDTSTGKYGAFVNTTEQTISGDYWNSYTRWWATADTSSVQELSSSDLNGKMHRFVISYDGSSKKLTITYTETDGTVLTWYKTVSTTSEVMAMVVSASTGGLNNLQQFQIESFDYYQAATVNVKYVDTTGKTIADGNATYPNGPYVTDSYSTEQKDIAGYTFLKMDDGTVTGTASIAASGTLEKSGDNGTVVYVYISNTDSQLVSESTSSSISESTSTSVSES